MEKFKLFSILVIIYFTGIYVECKNEAELKANSLFLLKFFLHAGNYTQLKDIRSRAFIVPEKPGIYMVAIVKTPETIEQTLQDFFQWPSERIGRYHLDIYPLYIGSSNNLQKQLLRHANPNSQTGFVSTFRKVNGVRVNGTGRIYDEKNLLVFYKLYPSMASKWLEYVFLTQFDFPFNIDEQSDDNIRSNLVVDHETEIFESTPTKKEVELIWLIGKAILPLLDLNFNELFVAKKFIKDEMKTLLAHH